MEDVIVIGGGPAGNGTALELAKAGYRVTVVDSRQRLGDKVCTGIVSVECLRDFPPASPVVLRSASSATLLSPSGKALRLERGTTQAYVIDRVSYVQGIAEQARQAGATYLLGRRVVAVQRNADGVDVLIEGEEKTDVLGARVVVIATGFGSSLTRRLGLGRVGDFAMGMQVEVLAPEAKEIEVYMGESFAPGFFAWLVPTHEGKALLGLLGRRNLSLHLRSLLSSLEREGKCVATLGAPRRWGVPLRPLPTTVADRVLAVGDAAGQVKPTTGGGIYYALLSSRIAAEAIGRAFRGSQFSASALSRYETEWRGLLGSELETGYRVRRLAEGLGDWQLEHVMKAVGSNGFFKGLLTAPDISFDWHGRVVQRVMGFPVLAEALRLVGITTSATRSLLR